MARFVFKVSVLAGLIAVTIAWFVLPARVPTHFGGSGQVDQWGSRTEYVVVMGSITGGLTLFFWVLTIVIPRVPESMLNIPSRDNQWWFTTLERREELNRRLIEDLHVIGAASLILIVAIEVVTMSQADRVRPAFGQWFRIILAVYLVGLLGYCGYLVAVRYRAPRNGRHG